MSGCTSDQADDGRGDGHHLHDCLVRPPTATEPGELCIRRERSGLIRAGRTYTAWASASDECGNVSAPAAVGAIHVPHDRSGRR